MGLLEVDDLHAGYGNFLVLKGVDLEVREGEVLCVIGPNGAGKSTLFRCLFNLLTPERGEIRLRGENTIGLSQRELLNRGMAYVLQRSAVFPDMTIRENLRMGAFSAPDGYDFDAKVEEMFDVFPALKDRQGDRAGAMSGGQQQMLELARGLMLDPDALLLDEPSAGLAPAIVDDVFGKIQEINDRGVTILMIEQNVKTGLAHSDRGYVLENGQTKHHGPADGLLERPEVREAYLHGG